MWHDALETVRTRQKGSGGRCKGKSRPAAPMTCSPLSCNGHLHKGVGLVQQPEALLQLGPSLWASLAPLQPSQWATPCTTCLDP